MAKKIRPVTKLTMALPTLLMGKGVTTAFDYTRGKFLGTSKDVESLTDFSKRHNNLINEMRRGVSRKDIETYNRLCQEYNRKLVDKGYGMKRSVFKKLDFIDLRSLPVNNDGNGAQMPTFRILSEADYSDYISRIFSENVSEDTMMDNALCLLIPPFTELGFCFTPQRYGYMKVKEIDMVAHTIDITVQDYTGRQVPSTHPMPQIHMESTNLSRCQSLIGAKEKSRYGRLWITCIQSLPWTHWQKLADLRMWNWFAIFCLPALYPITFCMQISRY